MTTERQIIANRQNALLSTGPVTPEGRAIAAQNALRHGLFAERTVVFGEDPAAFADHRRTLLAGLNPVGPLETLLAERIVAIAWRLLRTGRIQSEAFDLLNPDSCERKRKYYRWTLGRTIVNDLRDENILERLLAYEHRIEQSLYKACLELERLQSRRLAKTPVATLLQLHPLPTNIGNLPEPKPSF
jgi:hypothetical protein